MRDVRPARCTTSSRDERCIPLWPIRSIAKEGATEFTGTGKTETHHQVTASHKPLRDERSNVLRLSNATPTCVGLIRCKTQTERFEP